MLERHVHISMILLENLFMCILSIYYANENDLLCLSVNLGNIFIRISLKYKNDMAYLNTLHI